MLTIIALILLLGFAPPLLRGRRMAVAGSVAPVVRSATAPVAHLANPWAESWRLAVGDFPAPPLTARPGPPMLSKPEFGPP